MKRLPAIGALTFSLLVLAVPPSAIAGWTPTAPMKTGRAEHALVLLPTGKVLAAGGADADYPSVVATATAELYDPATGLWTDTAPMSTPRTRVAAALLPNGTVLVAGGATTGNDALATSELYDPVTGQWTARGPLGGKRVWTALVPVGDGALLIGGKTTHYFGQDSTTLVEAYDPGGTWKTVKPLLKARYGTFIAIGLADGRVLVAGGFEGGNADDVTLAEAELYDPKTGEWTVTGSLNVARATAYAVRLGNGNVLVAGGISHPAAGQESGGTFTAEVYDVATGKWAMLGEARGITGKVFMTYRQNATPLLPSGDALMIFGRTGSGVIADRFVTGKGQWEQTCEADGTAFFDHASVLLPGGRLLLAGGSTNGMAPAAKAAFLLTTDGERCACNADCVGASQPYCQPPEGQDAGVGAGTCVVCRKDEHCPPGSQCLGGACVIPTPDAGAVDAAGAAPPDAAAGPDAAVNSDAPTGDAALAAGQDAPGVDSGGTGVKSPEGGGSGCDCRAGGASRPSPRWAWLFLAVAAWLRRQRRQRQTEGGSDRLP
jgi:MYXO-CTERM domain-containing protein